MISRAIIILFVFTAVFLAWDNQRFIQAPAPCQEPVPYTIGALDRRFGISYKDFLSALSQAEAIWEKPLGRELFAYTPREGKLSINLIYDYRQEATSVLSDLGGAVAEDETLYNTLQVRYDRLKTKYDNAKSVYDARVEIFGERKSTYQRQIESWNLGQRTARMQFDQLERSRETLETEAAELKILEARLNEMVKEINTLVETLNRLALSLNLKVEAYNTIGASRGESFTGGVYRSVEGRQGIDIYEFSSRAKLVRIMAHELGHALGLEHLDDQKAIMYRLNEGEAEVLTSADLEALRTLCGVK